MKNRRVLAFFVFALLALSLTLWKHVFSPSSSQDLASTSANGISLSGDLLTDAQNFLQLVQDQNRFTAQTCPVLLHEITTTFDNVDPKNYRLADTQKNYLQIINTFWQLRLTLHERLKEFVRAGEVPSRSSTDACVNAIRDTIRMARFTEDYLGEEFLGIPPFVDGKDPVSINTLQGDAPHLLKAPGVDTVTLRSGDLIISRGTAYTSAAIARIGTVPSQFSHLAVVYVEDEPEGKEFTIPEAMNNPHVQMLEAHIEIGSTIRPFRQYVADGNARNFLFRYHDANKAAQAARWAHDFLMNHRIEAQKKNGGAIDDPNNNVPYDFHMNLGDFSEIFCSEMGYMAYHSVGLELPEFSTVLESHNDVVKTLGIQMLVNFAPGDLELDTRFEPLAEWRDYRKMHSVRFKDATLAAMFRWMKDRDYHFHPNTIIDVKSLLAWLARHADLAFTKNQLPKNMPVATLNMVFTLDKVGTTLENNLSETEKKYWNETGRLMTLAQMENELDQFREQDADLYRKGRLSQFHFEFHSPEEAGH